MKTPNPKHQTPKKSQSPNSKSRIDAGLEVEVWSFSGVWGLEFRSLTSHPWRQPFEIMNDLRCAFLRLPKNPGFTAMAVTALALIIGPNTAVFRKGLRIENYELRIDSLREPSGEYAGRSPSSMAQFRILNSQFSIPALLQTTFGSLSGFVPMQTPNKKEIM